jgi:hypothetical protein
MKRVLKSCEIPQDTLQSEASLEFHSALYFARLSGDNATVRFLKRHRAFLRCDAGLAQVTFGQGLPLATPLAILGDGSLRCAGGEIFVDCRLSNHNLLPIDSSQEARKVAHFGEKSHF